MVAFFRRHRLPSLLLSLLIIAAVTAVSPLEKTLGANVRLIYFHGAWVWTGKVAFALAGAVGLAALLFPGLRARLAGWSLALGRAGLVFWLTYLPLSLLVQQLNWGGIFWDEPRWRVPAAFGVAAVLVQVALTLFNSAVLTALANLVFGAALWIALAQTQNVLHPDSPIYGSGSLRIEFFFSLLVALSLVCLLQITLWIREAGHAAN
ncbi:MAG: hypothetical protein HY835_06870 [Anaerolineae bacterium]|nr:hypothetical protein [Anaerolineae bacterium]